jgi:hypothetical protein
VHFNSLSQKLSIVHLEPAGEFSGSREGRIRWRAVTRPPSAAKMKQWKKAGLGDCDEQGVSIVPLKKMEKIAAEQVIGTSFVEYESFDIQEEDSIV